MAKGKDKFEVTDLVRVSQKYRNCGNTYAQSTLGVIYKNNTFSRYSKQRQYFIFWAKWPEVLIKDNYFVEHELEKVEDYE